jgi:hypothetical protein
LYFWTKQSRNGYTWTSTARGSEFVRLLPFMEQEPLYSKIDMESAGTPQICPYNSAVADVTTNPQTLVRSASIPSYLCPSNTKLGWNRSRPYQRLWVSSHIRHSTIVRAYLGSPRTLHINLRVQRFLFHKR